MEPDIERYLQSLLREVRTVLADQLIGVYAGGSTALHAYQAGRSDIDVAVVCTTSLSERTKWELVERLRHEALHCPARRLELVVYRKDVAGGGAADPGFELEINTGVEMDTHIQLRPGEIEESHGLFWYGLDRSILHQSGLALSGPPASDVFADLAPPVLQELLKASLRWWMTRAPAVGDVPGPRSEDAVLGACRALVKFRSGEWLSKVAAGLRLIDEDCAQSELIKVAIAARDGGPAPSTGPAKAFQQHVLDALSGGASTQALRQTST